MRKINSAKGADTRPESQRGTPDHLRGEPNAAPVLRISLRNALLTLLATAALAVAHHGLAAFDQTKKITLTGTVTDFHFVNPHCVVEFDVKGEKGQIEKWQGQMTSPAHLKGWTATSLEEGNVVTVSGFRAKSGATYMWITQLKSSNGTELKSFKGD